MDTLRKKARLLRRALRMARDLGDVFSHFHDLVESPDFMDRGRAIRDGDLEAMVTEAVRSTGVITGTTLLLILQIEVPDLGLVHGPLQLPDCCGGFVYFPRDRRGAIALDRGDGHVHYARFSAVAIASGPPGVN